LASAIVFIVVSLMTAPPNEEQIKQFTYRKGLVGLGMENQPLYLDYRLHMALLLALIIYILILFW
jgi:hypothetical protein